MLCYSFMISFPPPLPSFAVNWQSVLLSPPLYTLLETTDTLTLPLKTMGSPQIPPHTTASTHPPGDKWWLIPNFGRNDSWINIFYTVNEFYDLIRFLYFLFNLQSSGLDYFCLPFFYAAWIATKKTWNRRLVDGAHQRAFTRDYKNTWEKKRENWKTPEIIYRNWNNSFLRHKRVKGWFCK